MTNLNDSPNPTESAETLRQWRLNWEEGAIHWNDNWQVRAEQQENERENAKRDRARRERRTFGKQLWGAGAETLKATIDLAKLEKFGLPALENEAAVATWLGLKQGHLRWFSFDSPAELMWHYHRFTIAKKNGGQRVIHAPKRQLKAIQRKLLRNILDKLPIHEAAHGFVPKRSVVSNAGLHVGKKFVLKMDLSHFFTSIGFRRVRGLFISMGYGYTVANILALLCTEYERVPFKRGQKVFSISIGERHLIQGAPTSPAISNLIVRRLDRRMSKAAALVGCVYSRYGDDMTFSADTLQAILDMRKFANKIIESEGFFVNAQKNRLLRQSGQQRVTGVVVNNKTSTPRDLRRKVRAILHNAQKTGLNAQNLEGRPNFRAYLGGLIAFIHQVEPKHAEPLWAALKSLPD
jgi:RNA-directed DNA polymerase